MQVEGRNLINICQNNFNTNPFSLEEMEIVLSKTKSDKQPGPDGLMMELFKWMDTGNREHILSILNKWWEVASAPGELFLARVVSIYKKGNTDDPANYRPISLLNSMYKVYMSLIRNRLQQTLEENLCPTQYGFRPSRSTAHAIYLTRRLQDISEQQGSNLVITLLDWEKAFDRLQHDKLSIALYRLGLPQHLINTIENGFAHAKFYVEDEYSKSGIKTQSAGIRQGCPLSPYLFVLVMSVIDNDVSSNLSLRTINARHSGIDFDRIYYADDTLLVTTNTRAAHDILHQIELISIQFGLQLNRDKCAFIAMNGDNQIRFRDGTKLNKVYEATYLGHQLTQNMHVRHEINHKMQQTLVTWYKLQPLWKAAGCSKKWKLEVYDAIIKNKLLYGLETVHLTMAMQKKVNAFQLRGFRKILGLQTTYVNRANTNEVVMRKANEEINKNRSGNKRVLKLFSDLVLERRGRLAGHIIRAPPEDPLRQVSYQPNSADSYTVGKRRVGGPRQQWLFHSNKYIWENVLGHTFNPYISSQHQNNEIFRTANDRQF